MLLTAVKFLVTLKIDNTIIVDWQYYCLSLLEFWIVSQSSLEFTLSQNTIITINWLHINLCVCLLSPCLVYGIRYDYIHLQLSFSIATFNQIELMLSNDINFFKCCDKHIPVPYIHVNHSKIKLLFVSTHYQFVSYTSHAKVTN